MASTPLPSPSGTTEQFAGLGGTSLSSGSWVIFGGGYGSDTWLHDPDTEMVMYPQAIVQALTRAWMNQGLGAPTENELRQIAEYFWSDQNVQDIYAMVVDPNKAIAAGYSVEAILPMLASTASAYLFSPSKSQSAEMLDFGINAIVAAGKTPSAEQQQYLLQGGGAGGVGSANTIRAEIIAAATKAGIDPALALAIAVQETGLNPGAVDSINFAELARLSKQHPEWTPGQLAAAAQGAGDPGGYADLINDEYGQIKAGKLPGISFGTKGGGGGRTLESEWPQAVAAFRSAFGRRPTTAELQALVGDNPNDAQLKQRIEAMPSHIPGMNVGQYNSASTNLNSAMNNVFGHDGTDAMVKEFFDRGAGLSPVAAKDWVQSWDIHNNLDPKLYNQIWAASKPALQSIWNQTGFDPRIALHIAQTNELTTPTPTESARVIMDSEPEPVTPQAPVTPSPPLPVAQQEPQPEPQNA